MGIIAPGVWGQSPSEAEAACRYCLQMLSAGTIKIRKFRTIHLAIQLTDMFHGWGAKRHFWGLSRTDLPLKLFSDVIVNGSAENFQFGGYSSGGVGDESAPVGFKGEPQYCLGKLKQFTDFDCRNDQNFKFRTIRLLIQLTDMFHGWGAKRHFGVLVPKPMPRAAADLINSLITAHLLTRLFPCSVVCVCAYHDILLHTITISHNYKLALLVYKCRFSYLLTYCITYAVCNSLP